jgi:hypothetical protein
VSSTSYAASFKKDGSKATHENAAAQIASNNVVYGVCNTQNMSLQDVFQTTTDADNYVASLRTQRGNGAESLSICTIVIS